MKKNRILSDKREERGEKRERRVNRLCTIKIQVIAVITSSLVPPFSFIEYIYRVVTAFWHTQFSRITLRGGERRRRRRSQTFFFYIFSSLLFSLHHLSSLLLMTVKTFNVSLTDYYTTNIERRDKLVRFLFLLILAPFHSFISQYLIIIWVDTMSMNM